MKKYLLLAVIILAAKHTIAQNNTYNYSQSYSSMNNVLAKQQAETRQRDQHYQNVYGNRTNKSSYSSSYSWNKPVYTAPAKKTYTNNYSSTASYSNWGDSYAQQQKREQRYREEEALRRAAAERVERERELARQRMEAEMERLRKEQEAKLLQERLAYLETRKPALKADPFQTIYTPPIFKDNTEKFRWYYDQAYNLRGITDPYACLIVSQMALDGEGCQATTWVARQKNNDAVFSSLSLFIAAQVNLLSEKKENWWLVMDLLKASTDYMDKSNGHFRAYKKLLELYRSNNLFGYSMPKDLGNRADVYAFAARNGDTKALDELKQLIADYPDSIKNFSAKQFKSITQTLPVIGEQGDYGMHIWNALGEKLQAIGDTACFSAYAKSFENPAVQKAIINHMHIRMLHLYHNDSRFATRLTKAQYETVVESAKAYIQGYDNYKGKGFKLTSDALSLLYKYYSGHCGTAANPEKAAMAATDNLLDHHQFSDLEQAALAYRMGNGGWPKNDTKAAQLFRLISVQATEISETQREAKAKSMAAIADFWAADPENGLTKNESEINYFLSQAARLDSTYSQEYADWCANKKSLYFSKENALLHYSKAIAWLKRVQELALSAEMPDLSNLLTSKIDGIKKKMAAL